MRKPALAALLLVCAAGSLTRADCPPPQPGQNDHRREQVQVRVADHSTIDEVLARINADYAGTHVEAAIESHATYLLRMPAGSVDCDVVEALIESLVAERGAPADPNRPLVWAELNYEAETTEGSTGTVFVSMEAAPGAEMYEVQYARDLLGLDQAALLSTGRRVAVAVVDTGIDPDHPLLRDVLLAGYNFIDDSTDTAERRDGIDDDADGRADEMYGHGTFMAGLIHRVAPDAMILPVVVLDNDGQGEAFRVAQGIYYAIDRGVEVINLSAGSTKEAEIVEDALEAARRRGILVVAAAGNDNRREPARYPAVSGKAIGVTATDDHDRRADFSNWNDDIAIAAPGTSVLSGFVEAAPIGGDHDIPRPTFDPTRSIVSTFPDGRMGVWEGTSVATAFVSGTAALLRGQHPEWPANAQTAESLEELLFQMSADIDALNPGYEHQLGAGRLDAAAAVAEGPTQPDLADVDNDGTVDLTDLARLLSDYGRTHSPADLTADGRVDLADLAMLLAHFGG